MHRLEGPLLAVALSGLAAFPVVAQTPTVIPGANVNMVSGTQWPDGDPFLQRQNEPSIAVSTRNPLHLLAGANDYRTVDLPGLPEGKETGDAWLGVFRSVDGGGSWKSTLVRGYPQDQESAAVASPLHGYEAAADPVVRAGTHGLFYYSGIVFDRSLQRSAVFVARFMDVNNETVEPIRHIDTVLVAHIDAGEAFIDKPWLEVDIPRPGAQTRTLLVPQGDGTVSQTVQCGNVYMAWAQITGQGTALRTRIMFSRSTDCGGTWSTPISLSAENTVSQGVTLAIGPATGHVHVAWRQFETPSSCTYLRLWWAANLEAWPVQEITVGGKTYDLAEARELLRFLPISIPHTVACQLTAAKLNVLRGADDTVIRDALQAADAWLAQNPVGSRPGRAARQKGTQLAAALFDFNRGKTGPGSCLDSGLASADAIVASSSTNGGLSFSPPTVVAALSPFDQGTSELSFRTNAYPTMAVDESGRVYLAWSTRGLAVPNGDAASGDSRIVVATSNDGNTWTTPQPIDQPAVPGHQMFPALTYNAGKLVMVYNDYRADASGVFEPYVVDLPGRPLRHSVDIRAAVAEPGAPPVFTDSSILRPSTQVSRYPFIVTGTSEGDAKSLQLQYNPPNLPMFETGTKPFFGDYVDVAGAPRFVPNGDGSWSYNTTASTAPVFQAVWTDNRDVVGPPDGDWTSYVPPGQAHTSLFDGSTSVPGCEPTSGAADRTQMRNQNIYTSRLTSGLFVAVPSNSRPLSDEFQRAFVVFVQNATSTTRPFRLQILSPPQGVTASFAQFSSAPTLDVTIGAYSSISQPVFVTSGTQTASLDVQVTETGSCGSSCLTSTVRINPDSTNPPPADATLLAGETYNPAVLNPAVYNPAVLNPAVLNPAVLNPAVLNPAVLNYDVDNPAVYNPAVYNPAVYNQAVLDAFNLTMMSLAFLNPAVLNPAVLNPAVLNPAVLNPAVLNPAVLNPAVLNPAVYNPAVLNPAVLNPAVLNPAVYNQTLADRSVTEANYIAQNAGTATMAYSFNLNLATAPPDGLLYQLMIYRLYFVPVANGCELAEAAQQELLVNNLDPKLDANLLDPNGGDSFFLNPGDVAIATLRVIPDPKAPTPGDPSQFNIRDLSASVVAKGVNPDDAANGDTQPPVAVLPASASAPLMISTGILPNALFGSAYAATLAAAGGSGATQTWSVAPGTQPPPGLVLSPSGQLAGTPTGIGSYTFTIRVTDGTQVTQRPFTLFVSTVPLVRDQWNDPPPSDPHAFGWALWGQTFVPQTRNVAQLDLAFIANNVPPEGVWTTAGIFGDITQPPIATADTFVPPGGAPLPTVSYRFDPPVPVQPNTTYTIGFYAPPPPSVTWMFTWGNTYSQGQAFYGTGLPLDPSIDFVFATYPFPEETIVDTFDNGGLFHPQNNVVAAFGASPPYTSGPGEAVRAAAGFTVAGGSFRLTAVTLPMSFQGPDAGTLRVSLAEDSGGYPGAIKEVLSENALTWPTFSNPFTTKSRLLSATNPLLVDGTTYWIVTELTSFPASTADYRWFESQVGPNLPLLQQQRPDGSLPLGSWTSAHSALEPLALRVEGQVAP
jgi:uncharacterized protein YjbI with pentapeptide repeats